MKLLIVSHPCITPINQQFYAEVERLTGWELTLVVPANWHNEYSKQFALQRWDDYRGRLMGLPVWRPGSIPLHLYRANFGALLREIDPDAIYVHNEPYALSTSQVYLANFLTHRKPIGFYSAQNLLKRFPPPFQQLEKVIFQNSHFAFPVSADVAAIMQRKGYQGNRTILPLGIDPEIYAPHPDRQALTQQLRQASGNVVIGYLGRIAEEKGLKTLLHALKQIEDLPWRFVIVGSGDYETEFTAIVDQLQIGDRIEKVGYIPHAEAPLYLSAFDIFVLPSETRANWKEQFGRVVIESLACGTPVIGSDSGEIPHLIRKTEGGLVFPEGQVPDLANRLRRLILDAQTRAELAEQGRKSVLQRYTNALIAQQFAQTIDQVTTIRQPVPIERILL